MTSVKIGKTNVTTQPLGLGTTPLGATIYSPILMTKLELKLFVRHLMTASQC